MPPWRAASAGLLPGERKKMETITITTEFIKLQDLLKFTHATASGGEAKVVIQDGQVSVNGEICTMRGKKIHAGDRVSFAGREWTVQREA